MIWSAIEILANFFQGWLFCAFIKKGLKNKIRRPIADLCCICGVGIYFSIATLFNVAMSDPLAFVIPMIYAYSVSKERWYITLFWSLILAVTTCTACSIFVDIVMNWPALDYQSFFVAGIKRLGYLLVTNILLSALLLSVAKLEFGEGKGSATTFLFFLLFNVAIYVAEEVLYYFQSDHPELSTPFFIVYLSLGCASVFTVFLFRQVTRLITKNNQYYAEVRSLKQLEHHQKEMENLYVDVRARLHDFKHHYQTLEAMVLKGSDDDAKKYLETYEAQSSLNDTFFTGWTSLDALLTTKHLTMKNAGISFKYLGYSLQHLPFSEPEFCAVIGNLLDNAIEGVERLENQNTAPHIQLTLSRSWNMFYILCSNPCNPDTIHSEKGDWRSAKKDLLYPNEHAFGIKNIQRIAAKYGGRCSFTVEQNEFTVKIVVPCL